MFVNDDLRILVSWIVSSSARFEAIVFAMAGQADKKQAVVRNGERGCKTMICQVALMGHSFAN